MPRVLSGDRNARLADGSLRRIVQLNNAATTPPLVDTMQAVSSFLANYGALHRGQGPRARMTCAAVDEAVLTIRRFIGAGEKTALLFTENSSAAVNLLARLLPFEPGDAVLTSEIEHTSNYLPWTLTGGAKLVEAKATASGALDYDDFERKAASTPRLRLIAITGASNQCGFVPDFGRLAETARRAGAYLFVDAAQLAPHRPIDMAAGGIDALAFSAHKVYAPFGLGVLALPAELLDRAPVSPGGGSIDMIGTDSLIWSSPAERHQTGTWNATGIVALAASCAAIEKAGWDGIVARERALTRRMLDRLEHVPNLRTMVPGEAYEREDRVGVFPFALAGYHHAELAAILEHEHAIEVRAGTICNHRLVRRWFGVTDAEQARIEAEIESGNRLASYGVVRASLGMQNDEADIDALGDALTAIATHGPAFSYVPVPAEDTFRPTRRS